MTHSDSFRKHLIYGVCLPILTLTIGIGLFAFLGAKETKGRPDPLNSLQARMQRLPAVEVAPVLSLQSVGGTLDLPVQGEVMPYREVEIAAEVEGRIVHKSPLAEAGSYVNKGDVLLRIDNTDWALNVKLLEQQKDLEYEALREIDQRIRNVENLIKVAREEEQLQENEIARLERLPKGYASESELDRARQTRSQALTRRVTQENELALLKVSRTRQLTSEEVVQTQLEQAQTNLQRTEIVAPISGVVVQEQVEINSYVQRGTRLLTIEDTSKAEVAVNLRMDQLYWVLDQQRQSPGNDVVVEGSASHKDRRSYSLPATQASIEYRIKQRDNVYRWRGRLERYDGIGLDPRSRTVPVRIIVDNPLEVQTQGNRPSQVLRDAKALVRGMFVQVVLHIQPRTQLSVVPQMAVQPGNRIWKFEKDMSVLDASLGDRDSNAKSDPPHDAANDRSDSATVDVGFKMTEWTAGRLLVLTEVSPIVTVEIPRRDGSKESDKYWICEVDDQKLIPGEHVVVSPLGGVAGDGSDHIRVPIGEINSAVARSTAEADSLQ